MSENKVPIAAKSASLRNRTKPITSPPRSVDTINKIESQVPHDTGKRGQESAREIEEGVDVRLDCSYELIGVDHFADLGVGLGRPRIQES
eukprot:2602257-Rhodomonas_salina.1